MQSNKLRDTNALDRSTCNINMLRASVLRQWCVLRAEVLRQWCVQRAAFVAAVVALLPVNYLTPTLS